MSLKQIKHNQKSIRILLLSDRAADGDAIRSQAATTWGGEISLEMTHSENPDSTSDGDRCYDAVFLSPQFPDPSCQTDLTGSNQNGSPPLFMMFSPPSPPVGPDGGVGADVSTTALDNGSQAKLHLGQQLDLVRRYVEMRNRLEESQENFELLTQISSDGFIDWNLENGQVQYSPRWESILGFEPESFENNVEEWFTRAHPEDEEQVRDAVHTYFESPAKQFRCEHRLRNKQGSYQTVIVRGVVRQDAKGACRRFVGTCTDVTQSRLIEDKLKQGAFYDSLTGIPNRGVFIDRLGRSIERAKRRGDYLFAVIFLDLDRFKMVNDGLGHPVGDQLLIGVSRRLEKALRTSDTVARFGGDEFALLLEDIREISDALRVAERIQSDLAKPFYLGEHEVFITSSLGICLSANTYSKPDEMVRDADIAMYRAKKRGRGCHTIFDQDMQQVAARRLQLEHDLHRAIRNNEFIVHYQPIVSLRSMQLSGFEALVRWQHKTQGLVSPAEFIPVAEETEMIVPIDRWVLRESCRQLRQWQQEIPDLRSLRMSVNLSRKQLKQTDLVDYIQQTVADLNLKPTELRLEVTESTIMEDVSRARQVFDTLKKLNILLHMDDFGTGYSSLSYLARFDIDTLKIDGSFVSNMDESTENFEIVRMVVSLAHSLQMRVIAEGVETERQLSLLKTLKCDYVQGYYLSRPIPADKAGELLRADPKY